MTTQDHATYRRWLDLDLAGELGADEQARLELHLEDCEPCRAERRTLASLDRLLARDRVTPREGFRAEVMESLPVAGWEGRSPRAWRVPLAALAALVVVAAGLVGLSSADLAAGGTVFGVLGAVGGMFATAALAGGGLLGASWQGLGLVTVEALNGVPGGLLVFAVLVVCLNLLLFSLLRRPAADTSVGGAGRGGSPEP